MTYVISTPDGKTYSLNLIDKHKMPGYEAAWLDLYDYKVFDSEGAWPGFSEDRHLMRRFYWKQKEVPTFTMPGEYRVVETGTFREHTLESCRICPIAVLKLCSCLILLSCLSRL